jgi:hypothetical protein
MTKLILLASFNFRIIEFENEFETTQFSISLNNLIQLSDFYSLIIFDN